MKTGQRSIDAKGGKARLTAAYVVKVAVMAAMLTALKFALSAIPNVEVVTLLILVYATAFGAAYTLPAVLVFCGVEVALYGVASWVVLYFVYWPLLAALACLSLRKRNLVVAVVLAVFMSVFFGVLSACADTLVSAAGLARTQLGNYWVAYYVRGLYFDIVHTVSNFAVVGVLYLPMCYAAERIARNTSLAVRREGETVYVREERKRPRKAEVDGDGKSAD